MYILVNLNCIMGNTTSLSASSTSERVDFRTKINMLATRFILTQQFTDLQRLVGEQYCNNLMILTKDLLADKFTTKEIQYLAMGSKKETIMYISKRDFAQVENGMRHKKMLMCKGVARFYVRISHLFAAIITTISPNWHSPSPQGQGQGQGALRPSSSPPSAPLGISSRGGSNMGGGESAGAFGLAGISGSDPGGSDFCSIRIRTLLGATRLQGDNKVATVQPTVCSVYGADSAQNQLLSQPGMPDLEQLYNDVYDYATGRFNERSIGMQSKYVSDLKALYTAFTGDSSMPDGIKSFGDINIISLARRFPECGQAVPTPVPAPITGDRDRDRDRGRDRYRDRDYFGMSQHDPVETSKREIDRAVQAAEAKEKYIQANAKNFSGTFKSSYRILKSSGAFSAYSSHIKTMVKNADTSRSKLLEIIDKLFIIVETKLGNGGSTPTITIHPELTYEGLDALINRAREMIIQLYVGCERDFYTGMKLLHVIIEEIMQTNMQASLGALKITTRKTVEQITQNVPKAARDRLQYDENVKQNLSLEQTELFASPEAAAAASSPEAAAASSPEAARAPEAAAAAAAAATATATARAPAPATSAAPARPPAVKAS